MVSTVPKNPETFFRKLREQKKRAEGPAKPVYRKGHPWFDRASNILSKYYEAQVQSGSPAYLEPELERRMRTIALKVGAIRPNVGEAVPVDKHLTDAELQEVIRFGKRMRGRR